MSSGIRSSCLALAAIALAAPVPAQAHAFAERSDLPLPLGFYLAGAGLAVLYDLWAPPRMSP